MTTQDWLRLACLFQSRKKESSQVHARSQTPSTYCHNNHLFFRMIISSNTGAYFKMQPFDLGKDGSLKLNASQYPTTKNCAFVCKSCNHHGSNITPTESLFFVVSCHNSRCRTQEWSVCSVCAYFGQAQFGRFTTTQQYFFRKHVDAKTHKDQHHAVMGALTGGRTDGGTQLQENIRKRSEDRGTQLRTVLSQHFAGTPLMDILWCELGMQVSGTQPLVLASCFPTDYCKEKDVAVAHDLEADFMSSRTYFRMSKSTRQSVVEMCNYNYQLGRRHQKEDDAWQKEEKDTMAADADAASSTQRGKRPTGSTNIQVVGKVDDNVMSKSKSRMNIRRIVPPRDLNEVDNRYLVSKHSITMNLPIPKVSTRIVDHATTSLIGCLRDLLCSGTPFEPVPLHPPSENTTVSWITETLRAAKITEIARSCFGGASRNPPLSPIVIPYIVWRDDFESNNSTKKKGSTWCLTVTFAPSRKQHNLLQQTYPLTVGKSTKDHALAEEYLLRKIHKLMEEPIEMFSFHHGAPVSVVAVPYAFICDQPERRKATKTMGGNSIFHARFCFSIYHKALLPVLRACGQCLTSMRMGVLPVDCDNCVNWDTERATQRGSPTIVSKLKLHPHKDYPSAYFGQSESFKNQYLTEDGMILPFQLTSCRLKQSFYLAFNNLVSGNWGSKQVQAFLDRECFMSELTRQIIDRGTSARALAKIRDGSSQDSPAAQALMDRDSERNPEKYLAPTIPFSWHIHDNQDSLLLFPDVLMHLLFLGIVKSTLNTVKSWISQQKKFTDFKQKAARYDLLLSGVRLDWLPVLDYRNGGFGGWVSENYLAFSRVMIWFFQDIPNLASTIDNSEPPTERPNNSWRKPHYVTWLKKRGQKFDRKHTVHSATA